MGEQFPRIEVTEGGIDIVREALTTDSGIRESIAWSRVDSFEISGLSDFGGKLRAEPPITIRIEANELHVGDDDSIIGSQCDELEAETGIKYSGNGKVEFDDEKTNNENFKEFIKFVFESDENWVGFDDLPISMPGAKKNFIINDSKQTLDEKGEMEHAKPIPVEDGTLFYNPKDPKGQKKEHIRHIVRNYVDN